MAYLTTTLAPTIADRTRSIFAAIKARRVQNQCFRQTFNELSRLSDRELADLGISRYDIRRVAWETALG